MKIAVSGKGGVGKTTISAGLARYFAEQGFRVYAVDADPDTSLGMVLGIPQELTEGIKPIVDMREVIAEKSGGGGAFFTLNPDVDDLLEQYSVSHGNIVFFKMGAVKQGGSSCYCRENSVLNALVNSLLLKKEEVVILDMGAGIEHLTRGTAGGVDIMIVVTEPSRVSVQTARVVERLAHDLGVNRVRFVGNKVRSEREENFIYDSFPREQVLGIVHFDDAVLDAAMGTEPQEAPEQIQKSIAVIGQRIKREVNNN
ncbi:P-loop NTPase [Calderihabitans maritimus]|uniref:Carbon monoxide dehydrogenase n=1 Tax=Calderihabitans maritimus TaxID=1246530 RepID=A0A1Z5HQM0_9FIRM|nr:P-loop NTPase [Calderihabitans maritimus]GAW91832.1 carbon monoxide dehydrogenase [Calderihabitans maritimus]